MTPEQTQQRISELTEELSQLRKDNSDLKAKNLDLHSQLTDIRKNLSVSEDEMAAITRDRQELRRINEDVLKPIAIWFRNNRSEEIRRGDHTGWSDQDLIIRYLGSGKRLEKEVKEFEERYNKLAERSKTY